MVNSEALADLSDAHRDALLGSVDEALEWYVDQYQVSVDKFDAKVAENAIEVVAFSDADVAALRATAAPVLNEWLADMDSRGLPGQDLYDLVQATLAAQ